MIISYLTSLNRSDESFFTGDRQSPWFLVAFGMIGAALSGVTFVSVPGMVANNNFYFFQFILGNVVGYLFITLRKLNKSLDKLDSEIEAFNSKSLPILENLKQITSKFAAISNDINTEWGNIVEKIDNFKNLFGSAKKSLKEFKEENPIERLYRNLNAISKGITAFLDRIKN